MSKVIVNVTNYDGIYGDVTSMASARPTGTETRLRAISNRVLTALEKQLGNVAPATVEFDFCTATEDTFMSCDYTRVATSECIGTVTTIGVAPAESHLQIWVNTQGQDNTHSQ